MDTQKTATPARVLSVGQTADLLGLSKSTVQRHIASGRIPALRLGRRVLIPTRVLEDLLALAGAPGVRADDGA